MADAAKALADALSNEDMPVFAAEKGATHSHQFALEAARFGGGQAASKTLRKADLLACGIGLPIDPVEGDLNGLRLGTPEVVRWGMGSGQMAELASLIARALTAEDAASLAPEVTAFRAPYDTVGYSV